MASAKITRISPAATASSHEQLAVVDDALLAIKAHDATASARKREIHIFHAGPEDTLQRMLNAIQPGSYIPPHRHANPPKAESIVILKGALAYVPFDDAGAPQESQFALLDARRGNYAIDSRGGVWHTYFALEPDTVVFEVKPGPYDAQTDRELAPWAPREGSAEAAEYLRRLAAEFRTVTRLL